MSKQSIHYPVSLFSVVPCLVKLLTFPHGVISLPTQEVSEPLIYSSLWQQNKSVIKRAIFSCFFVITLDWLVVPTSKCSQQLLIWYRLLPTTKKFQGGPTISSLVTTAP
eukprot:sb/3477381/